MAPRLVLVTAAAARAAIAAHLLSGDVDPRLGDITLAAHQVAAARRLASLLASRGGALLADDVGLGKTFVALAVARLYTNALVIAPAALVGMWRDAGQRSGTPVQVISYEALSRRAAPPMQAALVILDEAHHARSASARRYPRIAALCSGAHTLLLTATPLPNRLGELRSLFALFAGSRALAMPESELSRMIVRRTSAAGPVTPLPSVGAIRWIHVAHDAECLQALQQLPPAVPPAGGGDGGALMLLGLIRQWASSRAALVAALRRRLARSAALESAVAAGRMPSEAELRTWEIADASMQLAFPELVAPLLAGAVHPASLLQSIRDHGAAVAALLSLVARTPDPDLARADSIRRLRDMHPGEKLLCFSGYAVTARMYWRQLRMCPGVAQLTAHGGDIASGRLNREDVLRRFAPDGQRVARPRGIEDISMLIATDLLAEGLDLRDATVVVHLDLPWSPARLEQRVGRARRMGSNADSIAVYAMHPPALAEAVLSLERRLRHKAAISASVIGSSGPLLPPPVQASGEHAAAAKDDDGARHSAMPLSTAERRSRVTDRVSRWASFGAADPTDSEQPTTSREQALGAVAAAVVHAPVRGWLAAITVGRHASLAASVGSRTSDDADLLDAACTHAAGEYFTDATRARAILEAAVRDATRHAAERAAVEEVRPAGHASPAAGVRSGDLAQRVRSRAHRALARAAAHERPRLAPLAAAVRHAVSGRLSAGAEIRFLHLMTAIDDDTAWMAAACAAAAGELAGNAGEGAESRSGYELRAIVAFGPYGSLSNVSDAELTQ